ncbi:2,3-bisphosphoglycerate-independent phosphoglycerate mutase [Sphingopyxis sp. 113P3]|nr:2,3-bisphosphoglycerate-independent phosphoglycerate mutase [Sphingopyxis sp. 113P3]
MRAIVGIRNQFAASPLKSLADTLTSWLEPVARMWRFSRNNGITEGFHTKMEMISRRAFGFRNFHNYRLRVLALCGWALPRERGMREIGLDLS